MIKNFRMISYFCLKDILKLCKPKLIPKNPIIVYGGYRIAVTNNNDPKEHLDTLQINCKI